MTRAEYRAKLYGARVLMVAPVLPAPILLCVLTSRGVLDFPVALVLELGLAVLSRIALDWYLHERPRIVEMLPYTGDKFWERDDDGDEALGPKLTAEEVDTFTRARAADLAEWRALHIDGARRRRVETEAKRAAEESGWYREAYEAALDAAEHAEPRR